MSVPFPLPDLPRIDSDLARLCARVLELRDLSALTRLPDMLRDLGREADADAIKRACVYTIIDYHHPPSTRWVHESWSDIRRKLALVIWWDVFDFAGSLAVLARSFDKQPRTGTAGRVTIGALDVPVSAWTLSAPADVATAITVRLSTPTGDAADPRHKNCAHPAWEYVQTVSAPPTGVGWVRNAVRESALGTGRHWMRLKPPP